MQIDARGSPALLDVPEGTVDQVVNEGGLRPEWASARGLDPSLATLRHVPQSPTLAEALAAGGVVGGIAGTGKEAVFRAIAAGVPLPEGMSRGELEAVFQSRTSFGTTPVGDGIAIPHVRHPLVLPQPAALTVCYLDRPADLGAKDGKPVHTLFVLISPTPRIHLRILSRVAMLLQDPEFRHALDRRAPREVLVAAARRVEALAASNEIGTP